MVTLTILAVIAACLYCFLKKRKKAPQGAQDAEGGNSCYRFQAFEAGDGVPCQALSHMVGEYLSEGAGTQEVLAFPQGTRLMVFAKSRGRQGHKGGGGGSDG